MPPHTPQVSEEDLPPPENPMDTEIGVAVEFDAEDEEEDDERDVVVDEDEGDEDEEGERIFVIF